MSKPKAAPTELHWNIMSRFRDYVRGIPDGAETWNSESGHINEDGLVFAAVEPVKVGELPWYFAGAVRYEAYRGALRVDISDPEISEADSGYVITVNTSPDGVAAHRIPLATAVLSDAQGQSLHVESTILTAEGAALLGGVYPAGEKSDGFTVLLQQTAEV